MSSGVAMVIAVACSLGTRRVHRALWKIAASLVQSFPKFQSPPKKKQKFNKAGFLTAKSYNIVFTCPVLDIYLLPASALLINTFQSLRQPLFRLPAPRLPFNNHRPDLALPLDSTSPAPIPATGLFVTRRSVLIHTISAPNSIPSPSLTELGPQLFPVCKQTPFTFKPPLTNVLALNINITTLKPAIYPHIDKP